jgi:hypothetical protein
MKTKSINKIDYGTTKFLEISIYILGILTVFPVI